MFPRTIHHILMNDLNLPICELHLPTCRSMIGQGISVVCAIFLKGLKIFFDKVSTINNNQNLRNIRTSKDYVSKELGHHHNIISWSNNYFHPLRNVITSHQCILIAAKSWNRTLKIKPLITEDLYFKDEVEWHLIYLGKIPNLFHQLQALTISREFLC